jgi:hypothetical protein
MVIKNTFFIVIFFLLTSCNTIKDDFFDYIFYTEGVSLHRTCENNPSIFAEGRYIEIYSIPEKHVANIVLNIKGNFKKKELNQEYADLYLVPPVWFSTPVSDTSFIFKFIHSELKEETNKCFNERDLYYYLIQKGNYYLFLKDSLGRNRLFVLNIKERKLFLLSSYFL